MSESFTTGKPKGPPPSCEKCREINCPLLDNRLHTYQKDGVDICGYGTCDKGVL